LRTSARVATTLLTTALAVAGTATTASADTGVVKDKASDVLSFADQTTDANGTQLGYADSVASGVDLRSMRVKHTKTSVSISVKFSSLAPTTTVYASVRVDGASRPSRFVVNTDEKKGAVFNSHGKKRCTVPVVHKYGQGGSVSFVVKRSCLGNPKKVKVSAWAADPGFFGDNSAYKGDSLSPSSVRGEKYTSWLKAS
jgi:hypothetical protein